ncbi:MAG TPA: ABC transporter ATP-binding protein [Thermodesulfobacteriota bacterium]|nr:ABC transporter ATP-binding protein [Thermodesulfobacteriota bacterium]
MSYSIETHNLTKKFPVIRRYHEMILHPFGRKDVTVLSDVSIRVEKGELFGLLGPNGAGKTTLIKILCTLVLPDSGKALVGGFDVTKDPRRVRKLIGYVICDERSFYWRLTGRQNLKFFAKLNNISNREADLRIKKLLEFMELDRDADRMFKDYSTGMRQKLGIARGLLTDPEIIFMDEPTRSLDPITAQNLRKLIKEKLVGEEKRTVIFASHNLKEVEELCDRITIINKGEVKLTGRVEEIKRGWSSGKLYLVRLRGVGDGLLERISNIDSVKRVTPVQNGYLSDGNQIEVETLDRNGNISHVIKQILEMGGNVYSLQEREMPLEELFSKVVNAEQKDIGG